MDNKPQSNRHAELHQINKKLDKLTTQIEELQDAIEFTVDQTLTKRGFIGKNDITKLIDEKMKDRPTRKEMDNQRMESTTAFNNAISQSVTNMTHVLENQVKVVIQPISERQLEFEAKFREAERERERLKDETREFRDESLQVHASLQQVGKELVKLNTIISGEGDDLSSGMFYKVKQYKLDLDTVKADLGTIQAQVITLDNIEATMNQWIADQQQLQESIRNGAIKFIKRVIPTAIVALVGSGLVGNAILAILQLIGLA